ncbi:MAG: FAD-dependent oxidoreductase [Desulfobacteraceae bacterium]|nr:FAD-dependent oxidoreductase [Desulfobacteraceae bacterium]
MNENQPTTASAAEDPARVIVIGGGIGGIQCALDLAEAGVGVYLVERSHTLGGTMARLDKTFPTNDCSTCMFSPKLVEVAAHPDIEILTNSRLLELSGGPGDFTARIEQQPRYVDTEKCIACGQCAERCPKKVPDPFNGALSSRKAAFLTFPQAVPLKYALDPEYCLYLTRGRCGLCKKICPTDAVDFEQKPAERTLSAGAVVVSTGFDLALTEASGDYGYGRYRNVVSSLQYERMLSATGPTGGHPRRPSDDKPPRSVAWIQCVLSRDAARNRPFCSSVCCMHAAKQAVLTRSHLPGAKATIYFMDIRAHGKGFDDYVERARRVHGVGYRRSMISQLYMNPANESLIVETFDRDQGRKIEEEYDLVVLSSGLTPSAGVRDLVRQLGLATNPYGFLTADTVRPVSTSRSGIFVCGGTEAPKDIPETVIQAGAAAAEASLAAGGNRRLAPARQEDTAAPDEKEAPRVGVFVCHCGTNIAGVVDVPSLAERASKLPGVVHAADFLFTCSADTQQALVEQIREQRLNRVVVAACSPKTHEPLFRKTLREAGVNSYLFEMANIRNHCSWVHGDRPGEATEKAALLIRAAVARARRLEPLTESRFAVTKDALVVGAGIAGMTAALAIADHGFTVHLAEKEDRPGGYARNLTETLEGDSPRAVVRDLADRVYRHPHIRLYRKTRLIAHDGHVGDFTGTLSGPGGETSIRYGVAVAATGAGAYRPTEYGYGTDPRVLTQVELARRVHDPSDDLGNPRRVVMIQCVGSRNEEFPFCSRVCCSAAVKNSLALKQRFPEAQIVVLYRDLRTFGFKELYYLEARKKGVLFFRYIPENPPEVASAAGGLLTVDFSDRSSDQDFRVEPDLLVLSAGIRPSEGSRELARLLKLPLTPEGFFLEAHVKLQPLEFSSPGIYLAGLAHSPRFIPESIAMAKGAAQQAVKVLCRDEMTNPATVAVVDTDACTACLACVRVCPFDAPFINRDGVSEIPPAKCRGCGICPAECPARAIRLLHSTDEQIEAKIDALVEGE